MVIDAPLLGVTWTFPCGRWFAKDKDDGACERMLEIADGSSDDVIEYRPKVSFEVQVFTSDIKNAGADGRKVSMVLYGATRDGTELSDRLIFTEATKKSFRRGAGTAIAKDGGEMIDSDTISLASRGSGLSGKAFTLLVV